MPYSRWEVGSGANNFNKVVSTILGEVEGVVGGASNHF